MTIEQMRAAYDAKPFRPFVIHLADGRAVPVNHREFIMAAPSGRTDRSSASRTIRSTSSTSCS